MLETIYNKILEEFKIESSDELKAKEILQIIINNGFINNQFVREKVALDILELVNLLNINTKYWSIVKILENYEKESNINI